MKSRYSQAEIV